MTRSSRRIMLLLLVIALGFTLFFLQRSLFILDAPRPHLMPDPVDSLPALAESIVEAPVTYDLRSVIDSLEAAVPTTYGDLELRHSTAKNKRLSFAFLLKRSPFRVRVVGQTVRISADVEYSGRAWYDPPLGPKIEVACGTGGALPPRATLTLESTGELTPRWSLRTHSRVVGLEAYSDSSRDRCRLSFLRIDVTQHVLEQTRGALESQLALFDQRVAEWPVRSRFENVWRGLQKPIRLSDSVYMMIHPSKAELGSVGARGGTAFANLRLFAHPRVTTGARPRPDSLPLPTLERARDVGRGAHVLLDASFDYPVATMMLRKVLVGDTIRQGRHVIRIRDVALFGIGGGKVALGVKVSGAVHGRLYFTGTPAFDRATRQITVPNLDVDAGTAMILVRGYEWLNDMTFRDYLRDRARLPDSVFMRQLSELAEHGMNRKLPARGTRLSARIGEASVIGVVATLREIRVRAVADADFRLSIQRAPSIPRPPQPGMESDEEASDDEPG